MPASALGCMPPGVFLRGRPHVRPVGGHRIPCLAVQRTSAGGGRTSILVPLPRSQSQVVKQTVDAVKRALADGIQRFSVEWLLPVGQRRLDFLATNIDVQDATSTRGDFNSATILTTVLLESLVSDGPGGNIVSARMDDEIESEPVGLVYPENNEIAAMVFPNSESLPMIRQLDDNNKQRPLLLVNPQWNTSSNLVSDFGIGMWRKRAEDYIAVYRPIYSLSEVRVGNAYNRESSGVMRVFFSYPGGWQVHLLEEDPAQRVMRAELLTVLPFKPGYRELAELLKLRRSSDAASEAAIRAASASARGAPAESPAAAIGAPPAVPGPATDPAGDVAAERLPVFPDAEIATMSARMLRAALTAYDSPTSGKLESLRSRLKDVQTAKRAEAAKSGRPVKPFARLQVCRVCEGSGRRDCFVCARENATPNLACVVCGGWQYVLCAACQGGQLAQVLAEQASTADADGDGGVGDDIRRREEALGRREAEMRLREAEIRRREVLGRAATGSGNVYAAEPGAEKMMMMMGSMGDGSGDEEEAVLRERRRQVAAGPTSGASAGRRAQGGRGGREGGGRGRGGRGAGRGSRGAVTGGGATPLPPGWLSEDDGVARWVGGIDNMNISGGEDDDDGDMGNELEMLLRAAEESDVIGGGGRGGLTGSSEEDDELAAVEDFERREVEYRRRSSSRGRAGGGGGGVITSVDDRDEARSRRESRDPRLGRVVERKTIRGKAGGSSSSRSSSDRGTEAGARRTKSGTRAGTVKVRAAARRTRTCGICNQPGHDRRNCPQAPDGGEE